VHVEETTMTAASSPQGLPLAARETDIDETPPTGPTVGASDADADAARSGADADLHDAQRDSDGVPVGKADAEEDARQSGADDS
jgi:hypothetical protein